MPLLATEYSQSCPTNGENCFQNWQTGLALRLLKSIYGSVDSSRNWDDTLKDFLFRFGFKQCPTAGSIYIYEHDKDFMVMINPVDDELISFNDLSPKDKDD